MSNILNKINSLLNEDDTNIRKVEDIIEKNEQYILDLIEDIQDSGEKISYSELYNRIKSKIYGGKYLPPYSSEYNEILKKLLSDAGIKTSSIKEDGRGGLDGIDLEEKYESNKRPEEKIEEEHIDSHALLTEIENMINANISDIKLRNKLITLIENFGEVKYMDGRDKNSEIE